MADCAWIDFDCHTKEFLASSIGDALTRMADAVLDAVGRVVGSLGTMWVSIGTPNLTGGGSGASGVAPGDHAANADGINTVLSYATWIAFGICVCSLMVAGVRMAVGPRGEGHRHVERIGIVLLATVIVSGAVGLVTAIMPAVRSHGSPAVAYLQDSLWWYAVAIAVLGVIVGAVRMVWEQRAEPGRDLVKSLMTLVVVSGAGLTVVSLLVAAADAFSVWLLSGALDCSLEADGTCFGGTMATLLALTSSPTTGGLGAILIIVLGLLAVFGAIAQILLMVVRAGMLVILAGVLPVAAAATNTETGRNMFRKSVGWMLAFILYKPAAAIVYATAFKLAGSDVFSDDGSGLISVIVGLTLMLMSLLALPALMSLIVPAVSGVAGGAGMSQAAFAGAAMLPTGAMSAGRLTGGGGDAGGASAPPTGASSTGGAGPAGGAAPSGGGGPAGAGGPAGGSGSSGASGASGGSSLSGGSAAGGAGAASAATGAGSAAGGGAAAGAAGGPVGAAVGAAVQLGTETLKAAGSAVSAAAHESAGGPDGSR